MGEKRKIRLVAFDLDGTTVQSGSVLSARNRAAIIAAAEKGVLMVPATGRVKGFLPAALTELPEIRYAMTSNGAAVWDLHTGDLVCGDLISVEAALNAQKVFEKYNLYIEYYVNGRAVALTGSPEKTRANAEFPKEKHHFLTKDYIFVDDLSTFLKDGCVQAEKLNLMYIPASVQKAFLEDISKVEGLTLTFSNVDNMEINSATCNKGSGLQAMCNALGIDISETMALGDNGNDLEMLKAAGFSVAVANAIDEVKTVCDAVVADFREDGFAEAIERFVL